jgi:hypothetical protein
MIRINMTHPWMIELMFILLSRAIFEGQVAPLPVHPKPWQPIATSDGFFIDGC